MMKDVKELMLEFHNLNGIGNLNNKNNGHRQIVRIPRNSLSDLSNLSGLVKSDFKLLAYSSFSFSVFDSDLKNWRNVGKEEILSEWSHVRISPSSKSLSESPHKPRNKSVQKNIDKFVSNIQKEIREIDESCCPETEDAADSGMWDEILGIAQQVGTQDDDDDNNAIEEDLYRIDEEISHNQTKLKEEEVLMDQLTNYDKEENKDSKETNFDHEKMKFDIPEKKCNETIKELNSGEIKEAIKDTVNKPENNETGKINQDTRERMLIYLGFLEGDLNPLDEDLNEPSSKGDLNPLDEDLKESLSTREKSEKSQKSKSHSKIKFGKSFKSMFTRKEADIYLGSLGLRGKSPVSALYELCRKKKWSEPDIRIFRNSSTNHWESLIKVDKHVYNFKHPNTTKMKIAKNEASKLCLEEIFHLASWN